MGAGVISGELSITNTNTQRRSTYVAEKKRLSVADMEAQAAFELPDREMMLVTVIITNLLNNLSIDVDVTNNNVAVQVCAVVSLLDTILLPPERLTCSIEQ
jgi:hypothetical protein